MSKEQNQEEQNQADILLMIVDWQEKLHNAMPEHLREEALKKASNLKWLFEELGHPIIITEQYPKGLGPTHTALQPVDAISKMSFSAIGNAQVVEQLKALQPQQVILVGMETHICISQTCRDLCQANIPVWCVTDACLSRHKVDWKYALQKMVVDGARLITAEAAMFEIIETAEHPLFKELSRRIR
ncbi:MAG: hydrolase [Proteobacteria bacterium]|nr:hydrolase [Pseudomonadota bacterium]